ncbi:MAG: hypothetical protein K5639_07085 [Eubacterium sp.]|nr:hypothetical protein [Eubacterium sp.]
MLYWYKDIMLDDKYKKDPDKHIKRINRYYHAKPKSRIFSDKKRWWERFVGKTIPWKEYFVIVLSSGESDLFEVMSTRDFIWRHFSRTDMYVVGVYSSEDGAISAITSALGEEYEKDSDYDPKLSYKNVKKYLKDFSETQSEQKEKGSE